MFGSQASSLLLGCFNREDAEDDDDNNHEEDDSQKPFDSQAAVQKFLLKGEPKEDDNRNNHREGRDMTTTHTMNDATAIVSSKSINQDDTIQTPPPQEPEQQQTEPTINENVSDASVTATTTTTTTKTQKRPPDTSLDQNDMDNNHEKSQRSQSHNDGMDDSRVTKLQLGDSTGNGHQLSVGEVNARHHPNHSDNNHGSDHHDSHHHHHEESQHYAHSSAGGVDESQAAFVFAASASQDQEMLGSQQLEMLALLTQQANGSDEEEEEQQHSSVRVVEEDEKGDKGGTNALTKASKPLQRPSSKATAANGSAPNEEDEYKAMPPPPPTSTFAVVSQEHPLTKSYNKEEKHVVLVVNKEKDQERNPSCSTRTRSTSQQRLLSQNPSSHRCSDEDDDDEDKSNDDQNDNEGENDRNGQQHDQYSQRSCGTDVALQEYEMSGEMTQVVGSQSLLSQELTVEHPTGWDKEDTEDTASPTTLDHPTDKSHETKDGKPTPKPKAEAAKMEGDQGENAKSAINADQPKVQIKAEKEDTTCNASQSSQVNAEEANDILAGQDTCVKVEKGGYVISAPKQDRHKEEGFEETEKGSSNNSVVVEDNGSRSTDEDMALTEMERSGAMTQVVGSQSLLSQEIELHYYASVRHDHDDDENDCKSHSGPRVDGSACATTPALTCKESSSHNFVVASISTATALSTPVKGSTNKEDTQEERNATPASAARKYGLISPREEENSGGGIGTEAVTATPAILAPLTDGVDGKSGTTDLDSDQQSKESPNCIQEEDDDEEENYHESHHKETLGIIGGESLSQQLDLRGLSQELSGISQEALAWADVQMSSSQQQHHGGVAAALPSVTPAGSATQSQEEGAPVTSPTLAHGSDTGSLKNKGGSLFYGGQNGIKTQGLECLLQAADQVSAVEENLATKKSKRKASPATATTTSPRRKRNAPAVAKQEKNDSPSKKKTTTTAQGNSKAKAAAAATSSVKKETNSPNTRKTTSSKDTAINEQSPSRAAATNKRKVATGAKPSSEAAGNKKKKAKTSSAAATAAASTTAIASGEAATSSPTQKPDNDLAQEAADLAARVIHEEHLGKQLLLSMVMERQPTRTPPETLPKSGHEMPASFVWSHYPPLEKVLRDHMEEYYHLSLQKRQSAAQQAFNNELVQIVRQVARKDWGWTIPTLDDKALRDRIRCYYKTHIQNAKKRLATMLKNPRKVANARHLVHHLHLIKQTLENPAPVPLKKSSKKKPPPGSSENTAGDNDDAANEGNPSVNDGNEDEEPKEGEEIDDDDDDDKELGAPEATEL
ncbi:hypothetical protein ACA910_002100 [Epithemia clementina (nom. ined.)]